MMLRSLPRSVVALFLVASMAVQPRVASSQELVIDPAESINDFLSLGEFGLDGDVEGWAANAINLDVVNGHLEVTAVGGDPHFFRAAIADSTEDMTVVEFRYRVVTSDGAGWELFWGEEAAPGFSGDRRFPHSPVADGEFHVYQYKLSGVISTRLTDIRLDPGAGPGTKLEVDYVRLGTIALDTDEDGLPDSVETNTGLFIDARDTGTDPDDPDTDGDGVEDGEEVGFGTDPNNGDDFPVPSILAYTQTQAIYILDQAIEPNDPVVGFGTATSFQVTPDLPSGLSLDATSGRISGTPTEESPATDYAITATFAGGATDEITINLRVANPFFEYPVAEMTLVANQTMATLVPIVVGPQPTSYEAEPDLPADVFLDPSTGEISGTPLDFLERTEFTVFATYDDYPDASFTIAVTILDELAVTIDPEDPLPGATTTLGEFDAAEELAGWLFNNVNLQVDAGLLIAESTGADPYFYNLPEILPAECAVVEARIRIRDGGSTDWQVFWAESAPNRGFGAPGQPVDVAAAMDGEFHVYRFDFTNATVAPLTSLRLDPAADAGTVLEVDYIRLGGCAQTAPEFIRGDADGSGILNITDAVFLLNYLFLGAEAPPCMAAANSNGEGSPNLTSAIYILNFLFLGGESPPLPYPDCGPGTQADNELGCEVPPEGCQ